MPGPVGGTNSAMLVGGRPAPLGPRHGAAPAVPSLVEDGGVTSFGQLNTGKFAVINRIERFLPAAVFFAEWEALERGQNPKVYRSFTSREIWAPRMLMALYILAAAGSGLLAFGAWHI